MNLGEQPFRGNLMVHDELFYGDAEVSYDAAGCEPFGRRPLTG